MWKNYLLFYGSGDNTVLDEVEGLNSNQNYTITFVQDGLTKRKLYINGVFKKENSALSLTKINYNNITINPLLYNLKLNNVLIYNRALSATEIQELYELDKERFGE